MWHPLLHFLSCCCSPRSSEVRPEQRALPVGEVQPVRAAGGAEDGHGRLPARPEPAGSLRRGALHAAGARHGQVSWACTRCPLLCHGSQWLKGVALTQSCFTCEPLPRGKLVLPVSKQFKVFWSLCLWNVPKNTRMGITTLLLVFLRFLKAG